ncbi:hypothetical protein AGOR_G00229590 [Albula goreensis]|uniref:Uncharacterized protein n=1 Tax=Albula goreensis TaxID=1534307 RepID=A0A8T3CLC7_9TELE|nr:hypothetical protein AGOR_G00229590 [Albula goreensis]
MTRKAEVLIRRRQSQRKDVAFVLLQRYRYQEVDLEMTKLRLLNAYLTERLMVAVREILEVVEGTVSEYQEEAARTQRENENLRRRLREIGLDSEPDWSGSAHPLSLSASEGRSPIEQRCEQDWSSSFREDHELAGNEEEQELCENQRPKQACDPAVLVSAGLHLPAYDPTGSLSTARFVKSDHEEGSLQPPDLFKIQIVSTEGAYSPPGVMADAIKMEPSEVYCGVSEKLAGPLSLDPVNPECNSKDSVGSNRAGGGPLSLPEVEQPRGDAFEVKQLRSIGQALRRTAG